MHFPCSRCLLGSRTAIYSCRGRLLDNQLEPTVHHDGRLFFFEVGLAGRLGSRSAAQDDADGQTPWGGRGDTFGISGGSMLVASFHVVSRPCGLAKLCLGTSWFGALVDISKLQRFPLLLCRMVCGVMGTSPQSLLPRILLISQLCLPASICFEDWRRPLLIDAIGIELEQYASCVSTLHV